MKLLEEIIDGAASSEVGISVLLRKALVLASRLKNATLKEWCTHELNGYPSRESLPPYRVFPCQSTGTLIGPFGALIKGQPIPLGILKPNHREMVANVELTQGAGEMEAFVKQNSDPTASSPWAPDMVAQYQQKIMDGYVLNRAGREFPVSRLFGVVDTVRNRLLQLALDLAEDVGGADDPLTELSQKEVESKVTYHIYGGQNVIGSSVGRDLSQAANNGVVQGDFETLSRALQDLGVRSEDIKLIPTVLAGDAAAIAKGEIGANIHSWIGGAAKGAVKGTVKGAGSIATSTVAALIKHYLGI